MPAVQSKSPISNKLAQRLTKSTAQHASDETDYGSGGEIPAGKSGVARLTAAVFGEYKTGDNKGESFLRVSGSVVSPPEELGKSVMVMVPLCDTKSWDKTPISSDENISEAMNLIRKVGGDTSNMRDQKDWEAVMKGLMDVGPHFNWHTWASKPTKEYPNPKTKQYIDRPAEGYTEDGSVAATTIEDNTEAGSNEQESTTADEVDWADLGARAQNGDSEAEVPLKEKAEELGIDYENAATWEEVSAAIIEATGGAASGADSSAEPWKPTVGEVLSWKPKGPGKVADWEITKVFKETVSLKRKADNKVLTGIKWTSEPPTLDGVEL